MRLKSIILILLCLSLTNIIFAQALKIKGRVFDETKTPMGGASIVEVGNSRNGTSSDEKGNFEITLKGTNKVIAVSFVGYLTKQVNVAGQNASVIIELVPDSKGLEEVVVVGQGRQKRITNTGAVSSIKAEEIKTVATASVQNTLAGRLPGFFSQQRSGQPGSDAADFFIRGVNSLNGDNKPLIVVDDIEYDYSQVQQLNANEIETITMLKDAATTAIYGLKGANGVLVITTTRGRIGKPQINVTTEQGFNKVIRMPTFLDSYTTALLYNEATVNDSYGLSAPKAIQFSADDLQKFKDGSDPYGHPNVNWVKALLNNYSTQSRYNIDVNGGNRIVKYFTSVGYYSQDGILKHFTPTNGEDVNTNYFYRRFNFRSNLDITPIPTLKLRFDLNGRFETVNNPGGVVEAEGLFKEISAYRYMAPYAMPLVNPNGTYGYANHLGGNSSLNPINRLANCGYKRNFNDNFNLVAGADQKLDFITQGLSAKVNISYAGNINDFRNMTRGAGYLPTYAYKSATNSYVNYNGLYKMPVYSTASGNSAFNYTTVVQGLLNYDRTMGSHHVYGLAMINQRSYTDKAVIPNNYRGTTLRVGYDYKKKYMLEFNVARNGNDGFRPDQRYGIFPAVSIGWNLSEEALFKRLFPVFDLFKIRGSYGLVGSDYSYTTVYNEIQYSGGSNYYGSTYNEGSLVNPYITWEKERQTDIGLDINMLNGKIVLTGDYFYKYRYDQMITLNGIPSLIGQGLPKKNMGKTQNQGFDGMITYKDKIGKFNYSIGANISYAVNKIVYVSEAPNYPYQAQTGHPLNLTQGYRCIGFYQPEDFDANGAVKSNIAKPAWSVIQPGDLKYADINNDGVIDEGDKTWLSKPNIPTTTYGVELSANYKGFSLRALLQGSFGYAVQITAEGAGDAFNGNLRPWNLDRWTPATAKTATYPRIGLNSNINNISWQTVSDFWFVNASYIRLKSLELGYQLPGNLLRRTSFIQSARVYVSGYNLLNFSQMGKFQQDAEVANGTGSAYPNTANFNLGIQLGF
ncbi:MAG: TonB-dependent receptor [Bacteroidota bacterium]|nr:TonB-dependent receptor [Bacteroidota bacterium]